MKNLLSLAGALAFSVSMSQAAELPEASSLSAAQGFQRLADYRIVRIGSARDVSGVPAVPQAVYTEAQRSTSRPASVRFPKAPSRAGTGCYQSEKGCATISGFYISTKVALKKGGDCKQLSDLSGLCEDLKTKFPGSHAKSELPQMCRGVHDAVWQDFLYKQGSSFNTWQMEFATNLKAKLDLSEACCETVGQGCSWFADDIRIGYQQSGPPASDDSNGAVALVLERKSGNSERAYYKGDADNIYHMQVEVICKRGPDNVWKNQTLSLRVDKSYSTTTSNSVGVGVGSHQAGLNVSHSEGTSYEFPDGPWQGLNVEQTFCGSDMDAEGGGN